MNKILLALTILSAGAGTFHTTRQSTTRLQHEANATREAWLAQTQWIAAAQSEQAGLTERIRELKQALRQAQAVKENTLWSALQTNNTDRLPPELRERVLEELGFNWQSSPDSIVVSKQTLRDLRLRGQMGGGKPSDLVATVLALTPAERGQVEAAVAGVNTEFKDWALAHLERHEPKDDIVAHYSLAGDPAMSQSISNRFAATVFAAIGRERAEVIRSSARDWMFNLGVLNWMTLTQPTTIMVKRYVDGDGQVWFGKPGGGGRAPQYDLSLRSSFPVMFRPIFPNGWADVAKQEGFELPEESRKR